MSDWRENIQQASFRGKLFNVDVTTMDFGRRVTHHKLPFKDEPFAEDLGREGRKFTISAVIDDTTVTNQGYFKSRDELIDFIENDDSPGTLILPTLGKHVVRPVGCSVTFSNTVGGMETLQLTFVEAGEAIFPQITINTKENTLIETDSTNLATVEEASDAVDLEPTLLDSTEGISDPDSFLDELVQIPEKFVEFIKIALETGEQVEENLNEFVRTLDVYENQIRSTLLKPFDFFNDTKDMLVDLKEVWTGGLFSDAYIAFNDIFNSPVDDFGKIVNISTDGREQQDKNNQATRDGFRNLLLGQLANITVTQEYTSTNQIKDRRENILESFEQQIENAGLNNDLLQRDALVDLRSATLEHLDSEVGNLPDEIDFAIGDTTPVWTIANDLYGDAFRGQEIIDSNSILNPNFVPAQTTVKVLTS